MFIFTSPPISVQSIKIRPKCSIVPHALGTFYLPLSKRRNVNIYDQSLDGLTGSMLGRITGQPVSKEVKEVLAETVGMMLKVPDLNQDKWAKQMRKLLVC